ncbi:Transmembrane osmosensor [Naganishia albida]|nr:Transmembrane osmosensor [Naganishia albida]
MTVPMWIVWTIAVVGWWVAFVSMCVGESKLNAATGGPAMGTLWFAIIFQAAVIVHLTLATVRSNLPIHRLQLCFFLAILIVFAVNGVEYIYQGQSRSRANLDGAGALKAVGAGWLMLAIVDILWLLWLSSEEDNFLHRTIFHSLPTRPGHVNQGYIDNPATTFGAHAHAPPTIGGGHEDPYNAGTTYPPAGSGMDGYHPAPAGGHGSPSKMMMPPPTMREQAYTGPSGGVASTAPTAAGLGMPISGIVQGTGAQPMTSDGGYTMRAKALYAYTASPDDPNEVSFAKGEVLDIMDNSGKWWQCRNQNGQVGICPSNYVQLL